MRAFGGPEGTWLRFWGSASLDEGERIDYPLPLHGPVPSFTVSWEDTLGQAGAVSGVVESECITRIEHPVELQTVAGHESVTQTALMEPRSPQSRERS